MYYFIGGFIVAIGIIIYLWTRKNYINRKKSEAEKYVEEKKEDAKQKIKDFIEKV